MGIMFHFTDVKTKVQRSYVIAQGHSTSVRVEIKTHAVCSRNKNILKTTQHSFSRL